MACSCAIKTDEYHGWECQVSGGACMFLNPNSKRCAEEYEEGPDAHFDDEEDILEDDDIIEDESGDYEINETIQDDEFDDIKDYE